MKKDLNNFNEWKQMAKIDKKATLNNHGNGFYQCFCAEFHEALSELKEELCNEYSHDTEMTEGITLLSSVITSAVNFIVRFICLYFINLVGFKTKSKITSIIM